MTLKILTWDIETTSMVISEFSLFNKNNVSHKNIIQDWFMICAAWKWMHKKKSEGVSVLDDPKRFAVDPTDDYHVVKELHSVLMEADLIVGHNSDGFDWKIFNTRCIKHGLPPVPKIRSVDTYKIAKKEFKFSSNKLDYIAKYLGVGQKLETQEGLWLRALKGDKKAIKDMLKYNKVDVIITEEVYLKLRPFYTTHANLSTVLDHEGKKELHCPKCNSKDSLQKRGYQYTNVGKFQRYQCTCCGGWSRGRKNLLSKTHTGVAPSDKFLHSQ